MQSEARRAIDAEFADWIKSGDDTTTTNQKNISLFHRKKKSHEQVHILTHAQIEMTFPYHPSRKTLA